jgi:hypothetical protein
MHCIVCLNFAAYTLSLLSCLPACGHCGSPQWHAWGTIHISMPQHNVSDCFEILMAITRTMPQQRMHHLC